MVHGSFPFFQVCTKQHYITFLSLYVRISDLYFDKLANESFIICIHIVQPRFYYFFQQLI